MYFVVQAIVEASKLPVSIIIVGVGDACFKDMKVLDGDEVRLTDMEGNVAERDIVQFVCFNDFTDEEMDPEQAKQLLAKEVLAEVPEQLCSYMRKNGFFPKNKQAD